MKRVFFFLAMTLTSLAMMAWDNGYYLIGSMNDWNNLTTTDKFVTDEQTEGEYVLSTNLKVGDEFMVVEIINDLFLTLYPQSVTSNYIVDAAHAGQKTIRFRPDGQGGEGWFGGCIYVPGSSSSSDPQDPQDSETPNNNIVHSENAPTTKSALYDMDGDGTMEFAAYTKESNNVYKINRYSNVGAFEGTEVTIGKESYDICVKELHINNDGILDYLYPYYDGVYLFESSNGNYIQKSLNDAQPLNYVNSSNIQNRIFYLDANLNGRTDFYTIEGANYYGFGGTHFLHYRQADGSYLKIELQILIDTAEVNSALNDAWVTSGIGGPMITALENLLREYMFLPENTSKNPYSTLDMAIDIDQNGLVDLLSSTTGALLLNVGNNRFVQCKFPGQIAAKDLNNDGVMDYIMYDSTNKTVSLQISNSNGTVSTKTLTQGLALSKIWCYDFDNDGDVDILLPFNYTTTAGYAYLVFYRNDGNNTFKKIENAFDDPVYHFAFVDCKDVDNDGQYEIIAADSVQGDVNHETRLFHGNYYVIRHNNRFKTSVDAEPFINNSIEAYSITAPDLLLGDFDNDGRLDYWYTHQTNNGLKKVTNHCLSHFAPTTPNTAPAKMSTPVCVLDTARKMIRLCWNRGSDTESPDMDMEYSIRIGSTSGASDIWFAAARADGKQRNILGGNVGTNLSQWVNVADWPIGDYYIAVQAIDPNGLGGAWSDELVYHHAIISSDFIVNTNEMTTVDTLVVQFSGAVNPNYTYSWNFGDSAVVVEQNTNTQYYKLVYNSAGQKSLSLQVTDQYGNTSATETRTVLVHALKFIASEKKTQTCLDMNMDGLMDALRLDGLYKGKADGTISKVAKTAYSDLTFSCFNIGSSSYNYANAMSFIDYNMDGLPDIVEETNKGNVLLNEEDYDFDFSTHSLQLYSNDLQLSSNNNIAQTITNCSSIKWFDFNNDGWMDVNISNAAGRASSSSRYASINYGTQQRDVFVGGFKDSYIQNGQTITRYVGTQAYWNDWKSYVGDFNQDGYDDILTCFTIGSGGQYGSIETYHIYLNYGEDRFIRTSFEIPADLPQRVDGVADINNDGYLDLLFVKNDKTILVLLGDADLAYTGRAELRLPSEYQLPTNNNFPLSDCTHDFDNNGYPDIVTSNGGLIYIHPDFQITTYAIPTNSAYPFADLNNDGVPDVNGYSLLSRIQNQAPAMPQNIQVIEENGAVKLMWDAAVDKETPATHMRYNISVKKKGASVGQEDAFIISPVNGLYDEAAIIPDYPYKKGTQMYIPYRRFDLGQEYEFQIQSIDGWNAHSPMSAPVTFTVLKNTVETPIETPTLVESIILSSVSGDTVLNEDNTQIIVEAIILPDSASNKNLQWEVLTGSEKVTITPDSNRCIVTLINGATDGEVIISAMAKDGSGVTGTLSLNVKKIVFYTIEFIDSDEAGTLLQSVRVKEGEMPEYTGPTPTKESTEQYDYTFSDWVSISWTSEGLEVIYGLRPATADEFYVADYAETIRKYAITFVDWDGTIIDEQLVEYGGAAIAPTAPTRDGYTFIGWDVDFGNIRGNLIVTAQYEIYVQPNIYTIRFLNWDGSELQNSLVNEGEMPIYVGNIPVRPSDEQYSYSFCGWLPEIVVATMDADYTAQYVEKLKGEDIEVISPTTSKLPQKILRNGQICILRGDRTYTVTGQEIK